MSGTLVHYYDFENNAGGRLADRSEHASAEDLTEVGSLSYADVQAIASGDGSTSISDANGDYLIAAHGIDLAEPWAMMVWFKNASYAASRRVCGFVNNIAGGASEPESSLFINASTGNVRFWLLSASATLVDIQTSTGATVGVFGHAAVRFDPDGANRWSVFFNGGGKATSEADEGTLTSMPNLVLHARPRNAAGGSFIGDLAQFRWFQGSMTDEEIVTAMNDLEPPTGEPPATPDPTAWLYARTKRDRKRY
jgi:hypothetical protein